MAIEKCEHKYYHIVKGKLLCVMCGAGPAAQKTCDKATPPSANKSKKKESKKWR
jgi:hypothetical protein